MKRILPILIALCLPLGGGGAAAQPPAVPPTGHDATTTSGSRWAMVVVGLPGDEEHDASFRALSGEYVRWLSESLAFDADHVLLVGHDPAAAKSKLGATRDQIAAAVERLAETIQPDDALWYVALGHANYDGEHGWLHLAGPDLNELELAELFAGVECREQVFWLTHTCSGWFVPTLSRPGRIVVAATEPDQEVNETEFPQALLSAADQDLALLDRDGDGQISVAELFLATATRVVETFAADRRVPTEHAQLDDDGDGRGTEADQLLLVPPAADGPKRDGLLAATVLLPIRSVSVGNALRGVP